MDFRKKIREDVLNALNRIVSALQKAQDDELKRLEEEELRQLEREKFLDRLKSVGTVSNETSAESVLPNTSLKGNTVGAIKEAFAKSAGVIQSIRNKLTEISKNLVFFHAQRAKVERNEVSSAELRRIYPLFKSVLAKPITLDESDLALIKKTREELTQLELNRKKFDLIIDRLDPKGDYVMYTNTGRDILLINKDDYSVVCTDVYNMKTTRYDSFEDLSRRNERWAQLREWDSFTKADILSEMEKTGIVLTSSGIKEKDMLSHIKMSIGTHADDLASSLQNDIDALGKSLSAEFLDKLKAYAEGEGILYGNKVLIKTGYEGKTHGLLLEYGYEGLQSATYLSPLNNKAVVVYDIREAEKGFLKLEDAGYQKLLDSPTLFKLLDMEGIRLSLMSRNMTEPHPYIGKTHYKESDVGITEPENYCFSSRRMSQELYDSMLKLCEEQSRKVPKDVIVSYNPYNNSLNYSCNGMVTSLMYDENMVLTDAYHKPERSRFIPLYHSAYGYGTWNKSYLEDEVFMHTLKNTGLLKEKDNGKNRSL